MLNTLEEEHKPRSLLPCPGPTLNQTHDVYYLPVTGGHDRITGLGGTFSMDFILAQENSNVIHHLSPPQSAI